MPFRNLDARICTCALSPRIFDEDVYAVVRLELAQRNRPGTEGEDSIRVMRSAHQVKGKGHLLVLDVVAPMSLVLHQEKRQTQANCMVHRAYHADGRRFVLPSVHTLEAGGQSTAPSRVLGGCTASTDQDKSGSKRRWMDL
jgi:hypothetical protein